MCSTAPVEPPRKRVRTGCLTCRARHRKCDEAKPVCESCRSRTLECQWTVNGKFSESNSRYLSPAGHFSVVPSLCDNEIMIVDEGSKFDETSLRHRQSVGSYTKQQAATETFQSLDRSTVASRVRLPSSMLSPANSSSSTGSDGMSWRTLSQTTMSGTMEAQGEQHRCSDNRSNSHSESPTLGRASLGSILNDSSATSSSINECGANDVDAVSMSHSKVGVVRDISPPETTIALQADIGTGLNAGGIGPPRSSIPISQIIGSNLVSTQESGSNLAVAERPEFILSESPESVTLSAADELSEPRYAMDYSAYHNLQDALRDYMLSSAKSVASNPGSHATIADIISGSSAGQNEGMPSGSTISDSETARLLRNYVDEVASWLDMFDNQRYFAVYLPHMALKSKALYYSLLAISSRQLERVDPKYPSDVTLELYQQSIQYLLPTVQSKSIETIAACVVLCCLEMMSSSPQNWRRHLEGCAALFSSAGINGFCGGLGQALFWCFARMDLSCAVIGEESTIVKISDWIPPGESLEVARDLFKRKPYDMYANYAVFLCSRVTNLIASDCQITGDSYDVEWQKLWNELRIWFDERPVEMKPILSFNEQSAEPFPTILYGNGPAISGNQLYNTACILLMENKPRSIKISKGSPSMLWHAKQICAISLSNTNHGCWNNALQPLWIAGKLMSHQSEHIAILELLDHIETITGWAMKWRGEDLRELWEMQ
ncbi:fungal-specific transcription factor domain-containing protein [Lipomyces doorenjongii]